MDVRHDAFDALGTLRQIIEELPALAPTERLAATAAWRTEEDRLRAFLPELGLDAHAEAGLELQLLGCRLNLLTLAGADGSVDASPATRAAQDQALAALAALALTLRGSRGDAGEARGADAHPAA